MVITSVAVLLHPIIYSITCFFSGSPTDHSPVLNLSKSGGGSAGSLGDNDHSGSEADGPDVPPSPRSPRSAVEEEEDDNISEPDDEEDKDQGTSTLYSLMCFRIGFL